MGRLWYARSAGGSGGRGKLRLNRAKDILSSKTPEPQVGVARVSPLSCGPVQGNWNATVMKQADEEVPLLGNSTVLFGTFGCLENVYSGRHAHAQGQGQGAGAQSILLPSTIDNRFNARSLAGNPDSPQVVVFLATIVDVTVVRRHRAPEGVGLPGPLRERGHAQLYRMKHRLELSSGNQRHRCRSS